ncbi:MAG TPA: pinensin family lanthipeptide [Longimicrobium sp.]|nr:pinensin family lanthipeptide [Longimicrobium sp.]
METRKLKLDELRVESFATSDDQGGRGTVAGHQFSEPYVCYTNEFCGCNDGVSNRSCRATCYHNQSGCGNPGTGFTCVPADSCDIEGTCAGPTAWTTPC